MLIMWLLNDAMIWCVSCYKNVCCIVSSGVFYAGKVWLLCGVLNWCLFCVKFLVAPDAIHIHVKTCRENMKNIHCIAPEYGGKCLDVWCFGGSFCLVQSSIP